MKINGKKIKNALDDEKKKLMSHFINYHIEQIEKKIVIASSNGYDYIWYKLPMHYKYDVSLVISEIINILEKNKFYVRYFNMDLLQIIW